MDSDEATVSPLVIGKEEAENVVETINQWPGTEVSEPEKTVKWKRETNRQRKDKRMAGIMVCHYCRRLSDEPLKVEREIEGPRLKLPNFGSVYFHKSCKVQSLLNNQLNLGTEEVEVEEISSLEHGTLSNIDPQIEDAILL